MKYKFEEHNIIIEPDSIDIISISHNLKSETTSAEIQLQTAKCLYGVSISDKSQPVSWTVEEIGIWVNNILKQYEV